MGFDWDQRFTREDRFVLWSAFEITRRSGKWNTYMERFEFIIHGIFPILGLWGQHEILEKIIMLTRENWLEFGRNFLEMLPEPTRKGVAASVDTMPLMKEYRETLNALEIDIASEMDSPKEMIEKIQMSLDIILMNMILNEKSMIDRNNAYTCRYLASSRLAHTVAAKDASMFRAFKFDIQSET